MVFHFFALCMYARLCVCVCASCAYVHAQKKHGARVGDERVFSKAYSQAPIGLHKFYRDNLFGFRKTVYVAFSRQNKVRELAKDWSDSLLRFSCLLYCRSAGIPACLFVGLFVSLFLCFSVCRCVCLTVCLSVCLSLSVYLSI